MTDRRTRSAARKTLTEQEQEQENRVQYAAADRGGRAKRRRVDAGEDKLESELENKLENESGTELPGVKDEELDTELPHNLGTIKHRHGSSSAAYRGGSARSSPTRSKPTAHVKKESKPEPPRNKKAYGLTPGSTPFPDFPHPTPAECEEVNRLLSSVHGHITPPTTIPEPSLTVTGCGEVPSVLDALIRTLLSGATTSANSAMAFSGLVERFGILKDGIGKGSVDWEAVRQAPVHEIFEAIKRGGLADIKSKNLKAILDLVHRENQDRAALEQHAQPETKAYELACAEQHVLSLNHLHNPALSTDEIMAELVKYPGIGPKTAACVLLFCLQRPCFAVDTHIFRLCKWLGWVPRKKATEITTFSHLEVRVPDHLKYSLHQLLIRHGKSCPRCRAITGRGSAGWKDGCIIDHLVVRSK